MGAALIGAAIALAMLAIAAAILSGQITKKRGDWE